MAKSLAAGALVNAVCTFASRVLGLLRDVATGALFGLRAAGVMDAFAIAFRIPNLFRRLFGEGALSAAMVPVLSRYLHTRDKPSAWRLASIVLTVSALVLVAIALVGEGVVWLLWATGDGSARSGLVLGLTATMLPYAIFICLAAQASALLHTLKHFTFPAMAPVVLNVCWLAGVLLVAPAITDRPEGQVYVLAVAILVAGGLQLGMQALPLRRFGFRYRPRLELRESGFREIIRTMTPMALGLAIVQINVLADSLIAWFFSSPGGSADTLHLLGRSVAYPMATGAAGSLYFAERLYQFPLGVFGVALATAIYPLLSEHAAKGEHHRIPGDLAQGLRLVLFVGLPTSLGLVLLADPMVILLLQWGNFSAEDAARTARVVAFYGLGVWAYCGNLILVRGFYAIGDTRTPVKVGVSMVGLNLLLNLSLIWVLAEGGLALSTAVCATIQLVILSVLIRRRLGALGARAIAASALRWLAASVVMGAVILILLAVLPPAPAGATFWLRALRVLVPIAAGGTVCLIVARLLGATEIRELLEPLRQKRRDRTRS